MSLQCPHCGSSEISKRFTAMRIAAALGVLGGALGGVGNLQRADASSTAFQLAKIPISNPSNLAATLITGLIGAAGGCAFGAQLGEKLDRHVLAHNHCLSCNQNFNLPS